ncbi:MAG: hypothetical protein ABFD89_15985 [Bryobacteraceae bacterium]
MKIGELIAKSLKGETLTDEEKKALSEFDIQKHSDSVAAAARKEAEAKVDQARAEQAKLQKQIEDLTATLRTKEDSGKSELERARDQLKEFGAKLQELQKQVDAEKTEKAKLVRGQKLGSILQQSGIQFIEGVDRKILHRAFEQSFDGIDDLDAEAVVKPIVNTFRAMNKGVIVDTSGHGSGSPARGTPGSPMGLSGKPVDQMTPTEREADLKKRGIL